MRWSCLQFNVLLLPESYRRLPAETRGKLLSPPPYTARAHLRKLPGMWCEIKQKQQKMPKARANITVYSSTRFSGSSLILSCLTVLFSCGIVYSRVKRTPDSEKKKTCISSRNTRRCRKHGRTSTYTAARHLPVLP